MIFIYIYSQNAKLSVLQKVMGIQIKSLMAICSARAIKSDGWLLSGLMLEACLYITSPRRLSGM